MAWWLRACAAYNLGGGATLVIPGALDQLGVTPPGSPFWLWLPALLGAFGAIVLIAASFDLERLGALAYWNGMVRLVFAAATFALDFAATLGPFANLLALGDAVLGLGAVVGLPWALRRSPASLLRMRAD
jgi:hypothetical protein